MAAPVLQFKRGLLANLPGLRAGEPGFTTDSYDLYVGIDSTLATNKFFGSHRYWSKETTSKGSGVNLVEGTSTGTSFITLKAPDSLAGITTYTFPATATADYYLKTAADGTLSWAAVSQSTFSGIVTFTDTTDNTLGNANTGSVQIDGGLGVNKNVTVGANLNVQGYSEFVGVATFRGGTINLGDDGGDNINVGGEFTSGLFPNTTNTYDLGDSARQWRHLSFAGIGTFSTGVVADGVQIGISGANVIDTVSGNLTLNSAGGTTIIDDFVTIQNNLNVTGNVTIGGTTVTLTGQDVFIQNKDIVLGYTTNTSNADASTDITANHAGVAVASTEGTPLANFNASGINTLPSTYKQLMWFKSGTLGFGTDAFAFNYGVAIGTTNMATGVRLAVGSGITMSDTAIKATTFYGNLVGNVSTADQVKTVSAADNPATYYLTFVDANNGSATNETVYTDDGIYYNPGLNKLTTQHADLTGNLTVAGISTFTGALFANGNVTLGDAAGDSITINGIATFAQSITGTISTATKATTVDTITAGNGTFYPGLFVNSTGTASTAVYVDAGISYVSNTDTLTLTGDIAVNGGDVTTSAATFNLVNGTATNVNFAGAASALNMGANSGIATINNPTVTLPNATTFNINGANPTLASSSTGTLTHFNTNITAVNAYGAATSIQIGSATGVTTVRNKLTVGGNLEIDGNNILASDGNTNITLASNTLTTFAGDIRVNGNDIQASDGNANITMTSNTLTAFAGDIRVNGNDIQSSTGANVITMNTNNATFANDVTVTGNLYVNGSTTQVNTTTLNVKDALVDLGLIDTGGGVLGVPTSDLNKDIGLLFNYFTASAKKAAVYWDDSTSRIVFADDVTESTGTLTPATGGYAAVEMEELWINSSCTTNTSTRVVGCTGSTLILENITIDGGAF